MSNVVSISSFREKKKVLVEVKDYISRIHSMDKIQLLEEMVDFQTWRSSCPELTMEMIVKGLILFPALEKSAETSELRLLTRSYRKHLEYELGSRTKPLPPIA